MSYCRLTWLLGVSRPVVATAFLLALAASFQAAYAAITVSNPRPRQGQTIEVTFRADSPELGEVPPTLEFLGQPFKLFEAGETSGLYQALLAIPVDLPPGKQKLVVGGASEEIAVQAGAFPVQRLRLPKSKDHFQASPGEREAVDGAKCTLSPLRFWKGRFQPPVKARVSALFGMKRVVNGRLLKDYFHSGIDFAAPTGTPVRATAAGKVVLSRTGFALHGNTVAVDHGQGVVSFYIHLQKVLVKPGQPVKAGELIGKVGQTGRASGPHLHFGLYVNKVATNPSDWFKTTF